MLCETCRGNGKRLNPALTVTYGPTVRVHNPEGLPLLIPCPDCGGNGTMSCCEGMVGTERDIDAQG